MPTFTIQDGQVGTINILTFAQIESFHSGNQGKKLSLTIELMHIIRVQDGWKAELLILSMIKQLKMFKE